MDVKKAEARKKVLKNHVNNNTLIYGNDSMKKRTIYDPNEIIEYDDYAEIILYNKKCEEVARALIDLDDINKASQYKWSLNNKGYARNTKNNLLLHRLIMDCPKDMEVDHINRDPLDNRKSNLRICTHKQNLRNKSLQCNSTSGIVGVSWSKTFNKWKSYIMIDNKYINLGLYDTKEDAIIARERAEIEYFGEYRKQEKSEKPC